MYRLDPVYSIIFGGFLLRLSTLFVILNIGVYDALSASDSLGFYEDALYVAQSGNYYPFEFGWAPYVNAIGFLMYLFDESISMMFLFSALGWLFSALLIDKALVTLDATKTVRVMAALVMAVHPSVFMATALPMREPFQMLGVTMIGFAIVKIVVERKHLFWLFGLLGGALSGTLHLSLMVSNAAFLIIAMFGVSFAFGRLSFTKLTIAMVLSAILFTLVLTLIDARYTGASDNLLDTIATTRETGAALDARAQYKEYSYGSSVSGSIIQLVWGFFQYFLEPFPWNISAAIDIIAVFENIFRTILIIFVFRNLHSRSHIEFSIVTILLLMFFATEFFWSTGTINWGTAARHHVPSMPLLLMACCVIGRETASSRVFAQRESAYSPQPKNRAFAR
jgi:hypothetical protein